MLVSRGESSFHAKAAAAQKDGAAAVIIYNNQPGVINATVEGNPKIKIPVVVIGQGGRRLLTPSCRGATRHSAMEWTSEMTESVDYNGGLISDFSSWGVTGELDIQA